MQTWDHVFFVWFRSNEGLFRLGELPIDQSQELHTKLSAISANSASLPYVSNIWEIPYFLKSCCISRLSLNSVAWTNMNKSPMVSPPGTSWTSGASWSKRTKFTAVIELEDCRRREYTPWALGRRQQLQSWRYKTYIYMVGVSSWIPSQLIFAAAPAALCVGLAVVWIAKFESNLVDELAGWICGFASRFNSRVLWMT